MEADDITHEWVARQLETLRAMRSTHQHKEGVYSTGRAERSAAGWRSGGR
jgi:hypothetical protein